MKSIYPSNDEIDRITDIVESNTEKHGNRNGRAYPALLSKGKRCNVYFHFPQ